MVFLFTILFSLVYFLLLPFWEIDSRWIGKGFLLLGFLIIGFFFLEGRFFQFNPSLSQKLQKKSQHIYRRFSFYLPFCKDRFFLFSFRNLSLIIILAYSIHLILLQQNHRDTFFLTENDFTNMSEVLNETSKGNFFRDHFHGNPETSNYLAHHFSPGIIVLIPFLFFHTTRIGYSYGLVFFAVCSLLLWRKLILNKCKKNSVQYFFILLLISNPFIYHLLTSYHFESLFLFSFLWLQYAILQKKRLQEIAAFILSISLKEDISIYMILLGISFLLQKDWKRGFVYIFISVLYFFVIIPLLKSQLDSSASENWFSLWSNLGNTPLEILLSPIQNPESILEQIQQNGKIGFDLANSTSWLFLLFTPYIPGIVSIFFIHILSNRIWYNQFFHYYSYTITPFLLVGSILGFTNLIHKHKLALHYIPILCLVLIFQFSQDTLFPLKYKGLDSERILIIEEAVKLIPPGETIQAGFDLGIFIPRKNPIYPIRLSEPNTDWILLDQNSFSPYIPTQKLEIHLEKLVNAGKIRLFFTKKNVRLYKIIPIQK